ncbi:hypothetical protein JVT61DRAFT_3986 [Boletus reticuloceps]|uniref:ABC-2 type transporter transmembrane domain-containing protein n=1 Tax=Boletus reticuloceps TaxID=495285 RepID=A0A8I2YP83_9AGAM|nr:hypothetical protein JVT61DRAFT_3986 [Boletus reticuloceps]
MAVEKVLQMLDDEAGDHNITSVDVLGTSIEDIFLDLMESEVRVRMPDNGKKTTHSAEVLRLPLSQTPAGNLISSPTYPSGWSRTFTVQSSADDLLQANAHCTEKLAYAHACCQAPSCTVKFKNETAIPLYWVDSPIAFLCSTLGARILESPPNITTTLGRSPTFILTENVPDNATFVSTIQQDYLNIPIGGISIDTQTGDSLVAWGATPPPGLTGLTLLNLATNILYNRALNASGETAGTLSIIMASYASFPPIAGGSLVDLKGIGFFGVAMAVYPAFFSLYVSRERRSSVQAKQLLNGLSDPIGLWLSHLLWDSIFGVIIATIVVIVFATVSNQFYGLGLFWVVLVLYGIVGALFSYCFSLFTSSPLAAFAAVAGYQIIMFVLYVSGYLLTLTYAETSQASQIITTIHFTLSILSPVASVVSSLDDCLRHAEFAGQLRSAFVSVNLFSLLCNGSTQVTTSTLGDIMRHGGPIAYFFVYCFVLLGILVWADSRSIVPRRFLKTHEQQVRLDENLTANEISRQDVTREAKAVVRTM